MWQEKLTKTQRRYPEDTRSVLRSLTYRCAALKYAHDQTIRRNDHLVEAHRLLSVQYQQLAQDLSALASQHRSLQRDMTEMQTDAFAHEAVMWQYERQLAAHQPPVSGRRQSDVETALLLAKISEMQEEKADMQRALVDTSELLTASRSGQHLMHNLQ